MGERLKGQLWSEDSAGVSEGLCGWKCRGAGQQGSVKAGRLPHTRGCVTCQPFSYFTYGF